MPFAFAMVLSCMLVLRIVNSGLHRPFRAPTIWFVAPAGAPTAIYLMCGLPLDTWLRLAAWLAVGRHLFFLWQEAQPGRPRFC